MSTTRARQFKKFIGSSADDEVGVGELLEGMEIARNQDDELFLNTTMNGGPPNWVAVYRVIEVAIKTSMAEVVVESVARNPDLD